MLFFILYYLAIRYGAKAMPVPEHIQDQLGCPIASSTNLNRSMFTIVWSCVTTTTICAWVSVHSNVPPRSKIWAFSRRIRMVFWTIIAPELVLAWAVRQRSAAKMIEREFQDRGWTETHGHLLIMGGFTLINRSVDDEPKSPEELDLGPVSFEDFKNLVDDREIDFPTITIAEIEDRSKGDLLSKSLAVIQTTWFLLQCVARIPQRLALTELELVTLALASLNAVTYFFWWNKPLQVQEPVKILLKKTRQRVEFRNHTHDQRNDMTVGATLIAVRRIIQNVGNLVWSYLRDPCQDDPLLCILFVFVFIPICLIAICSLVFPLVIVILLSVLSIDDTSSQSHPHRIAARILGHIRLTLTSFLQDFFQHLFDDMDRMNLGLFLFGIILFPLLFVIILVVILTLVPFFLLIPSLFNSVFDITTTDEIPHGSCHVPAFYAPRTESDRYSRMIVFAFFGVTFGGLHVIGWCFQFPTFFEQTLWRVTSIIVTGIPLIVAPIDFLISEKRYLSQPPEMLLGFVMTILLFIYVPARLCLIAQAIALLRHQPPSAFVSVNWAKFIPHIL